MSERRKRSSDWTSERPDILCFGFIIILPVVHLILSPGKPAERSMVETLQIVFNIYDIYQKEDVRNFRESKFAVHSSVGGLEHLMRYLKSQDHTGLLYLLERFVDFNVTDDGLAEEELPGKKMKESKETLDDLATEAVEFPVKSGRLLFLGLGSGNGVVTIFERAM